MQLTALFHGESQVPVVESGLTAKASFVIVIIDISSVPVSVKKESITTVTQCITTVTAPTNLVN